MEWVAIGSTASDIDIEFCDSKELHDDIGRRVQALQNFGKPLSSGQGCLKKIVFL